MIRTEEAKKYHREWMAKDRSENEERYRLEDKEYYERHKVQRIKDMTISRNNFRLKAIELLGNKCINCGESDWRCLQFDHINGGGTKEHSKICRSKFLHNIINGTRRDIQLLCANCNWKKKYENRESNWKYN